jgi:hypothetical protein
LDDYEKDDDEEQVEEEFAEESWPKSKRHEAQEKALPAGRRRRINDCKAVAGVPSPHEAMPSESPKVKNPVMLAAEPKV